MRLKIKFNRPPAIEVREETGAAQQDSYNMDAERDQSPPQNLDLLTIAQTQQLLDPELLQGHAMETTLTPLKPEQTRRQLSLNENDENQTGEYLSPYDDKAAPSAAQDSTRQEAWSLQSFSRAAGHLNPAIRPSATALALSVPSFEDTDISPTFKRERSFSPDINSEQFPAHYQFEQHHNSRHNKRVKISSHPTHDPMDTIKITVGQYADTFQYPRAKLCQESTYFHTILAPNPDLTTISLPDIDPILFDIFITYLTHGTLSSCISVIHLVPAQVLQNA